MLRGVELACLLAGAGGELADQVLIGIAQLIYLGREVGQPLGNLSDDGTELFVLVRLGLPEFLRVQVYLREQAAERALEGLILYVLETSIQRQ